MEGMRPYGGNSKKEQRKLRNNEKYSAADSAAFVLMVNPFFDMMMVMKKAFTLVLVGISGSGKGTQAKFLLKRLRGAHYISTGLLLRRFAKKNNPISRRIRKVLEGGFLTPGWLASFMWLREIVEHMKEGESLLFDGAPRQVYEAELLDEVLAWQKRPLPIALYIEIGPKEAEKRLLLRGRVDDTKQAIHHRITFFNKDVIPMTKYYKKRGRLIVINGEQQPEKVWRDIKKVLHL